MSKPFFSAVIPVYNREGFIAAAVKSVLTQSFHDFELLVIDDGSDDRTPREVTSFSDPRIKLIRQENKGVSAARNRGVLEAKGKYIAFLDSDDRWLHMKLSKTYRAISDRPGIDIFHTLERWFRGGKLLNQKIKHRPPNGDVFKRCLELCCVSMSTAVVSRRLFDEIGFFDESLPACEDYEFWLRASAVREVFLIDEVLTEKEGGHTGQQSKRFPAMDRFRIRSIIRVIESGALSPDQRRVAVIELENKCRIYAGGCVKRGRSDEAEEFLRKAESYRH